MIKDAPLPVTRSFGSACVGIDRLVLCIRAFNQVAFLDLAHTGYILVSQLIAAHKRSETRLEREHVMIRSKVQKNSRDNVLFRGKQRFEQDATSV
jgi:hypothetical protein